MNAVAGSSIEGAEPAPIMLHQLPPIPTHSGGNILVLSAKPQSCVEPAVLLQNRVAVYIGLSLDEVDGLHRLIHTVLKNRDTIEDKKQLITYGQAL